MPSPMSRITFFGFAGSILPASVADSSRSPPAAMAMAAAPVGAPAPSTAITAVRRAFMRSPSSVLCRDRSLGPRMRREVVARVSVLRTTGEDRGAGPPGYATGDGAGRPGDRIARQALQLARERDHERVPGRDGAQHREAALVVLQAQSLARSSSSRHPTTAARALDAAREARAPSRSCRRRTAARHPRPRAHLLAQRPLARPVPSMRSSSLTAPTSRATPDRSGASARRGSRRCPRRRRAAGRRRRAPPSSRRRAAVARPRAGAR